MKLSELPTKENKRKQKKDLMMTYKGYQGCYGHSSVEGILFVTSYQSKRKWYRRNCFCPETPIQNEIFHH